jgi:hypothetical protein
MTERTEGDTAITVRFHKPLPDWTPDDQTQILRRLREYMRDHSKRPRKRRLKVVK